MSDRDWFFFSTVGLALISGLVFAGSLNYSREREGHYQAAQEQYSGAYDRISESAPVRQSLIADIEAYRQEWREEQDLEAQRDMAKWAWLMMLASFAGVSITAVGVVFVAQTLVATREAVAAANRTADEAKRIGEAQVRAYLSCESAGYKVDDIGFSFWLTIKNNGQSPAIGCNVAGTVKLIDNVSFNRDSGFGSVALSDYTEHHTFAAEGEPIPVGAEREIYIFMRDEGLAPNIFACMQQGMAGIMIDGNVAWQDVFGEKTISGFTLGYHYPNFDIPENWGYLAAGDLYARALPERTRDRST